MEFLRDVKSEAIGTQLGNPAETEVALFTLLHRAGSLDINARVSRVSLGSEVRRSVKMGWGSVWLDQAIDSQPYFQLSALADVSIFCLLF